MSWRSGCPLSPHSGSYLGQCSPFHIGQPRDALAALVLALFELVGLYLRLGLELPILGEEISPSLSSLILWMLDPAM